MHRTHRIIKGLGFNPTMNKSKPKGLPYKKTPCLSGENTILAVYKKGNKLL